MIAAALLACAVNIAPVTLEAVIEVESGGNPLAIRVNGLRVQPPPPRDARDAARTAARYIARGYGVDIGLMQVNSRNLSALNVTVAQALDPCVNIRIGAAILTADYAAAERLCGEGQLALRAALSAYNTGDFYHGFVNGYVDRYYHQTGVPAVVQGAKSPAPAATTPPMRKADLSDRGITDTSVLAREPINVRIE